MAGGANNGTTAQLAQWAVDFRWQDAPDVGRQGRVQQLVDDLDGAASPREIVRSFVAVPGWLDRDD